MMRLSFLPLLLALVLYAKADTIYYDTTNAAGCDAGCEFTNPAIWTGGKPPGAGDDAIVNANSGITLTLNGGNVGISSLTITGDVTFSLFNSAIFSTSISQYFRYSVNISDSGTLKIASNSFFNSWAVSSGTVTIDSAILNGTLLDVNMLTLNNNAAINMSYVGDKYTTATITNSQVNIDQDFSFNTLYSYGATTFLQAPSYFKFISFNNNPSLIFGPYSGLNFHYNNSRIEINDCITTIYSVAAFGVFNTAIAFNASNPTYTAYVGSAVSIMDGGNPTFEVNDGVHLTMASGQINLVAGNNVILDVVDNVPDPLYLQASRTPTGTDTVTINVHNSSLTLFNTPTLNANINVEDGSSLVVRNLTITTITAGICPIYGKGALIIQGSLVCKGVLDIGGLSFPDGGSLTVNTPLSVPSLTAQGPTTINSPSVQVLGNINLQDTISFSGNFIQNFGYLNITFGDTDLAVPFVQAAGDITFSNATLYIFSGSTFIWDGKNSENFALAQSLHGTINATFTSVYDETTTAKKISITYKSNTLNVVYDFGESNNPSFIQKYRYYLLAGAVGFCVIFVAVVMSVVRRSRRRALYQRV